MSNTDTPDSKTAEDNAESFQEAFSQYERSHKRKPEQGKAREGMVIAVSADSVYLDIGFKTEGILPLTAFQNDRQPPKAGDKFPVSIKGRNEEGYYELTRGKVGRATSWEELEKAFAGKTAIVGTVTGAVKGGLTVDVGVRAFLPASRSGVRDSADLEKLVGQEIRCRITKLDAADEDVVVDRRIIAEEEAGAARERRYGEIREGEQVRGVVRSLTDYGAFVDIGGVDGLLHVGDISWQRLSKPADVLSVNDEIEAVVLKVDPEKQRISLGMKQLQPNPWDTAAQKYRLGERARGTVTRLMDFGAFVELDPGVEGLIHVSEMSWVKKVKKPSDVLKPGETVETVILGVNAAERRISLGLKQALGDPWADVAQRLAAGSAVEGPVTSLTKFGAFVQIAEGVEGMIHVSEISAEKRINHPQDVLKVGQTVKAQVLAVDRDKRQIKLSIKQMSPTSIDEYLAEHRAGDVVSGRLLELAGGQARVELGEGIQATCRVEAQNPSGEASASEAKVDLASLSSMLQARWKGGAAPGAAKPEPARPGQIRQFRIARLDAAAKKIELELA
ncbi:MAG TPA: 30S ribosomal protein S1 [Terriglobales bacterium]|jgi:small subunit ribosomal protein S1|nr:30S ribosomal protein S1 [Terriglobales bacterium]